MCDLVTYISLDLVTVIPLFCVQEVLSLVDDLPKKKFFLLYFGSIRRAEIAALV
jgi:hypothetical protein